MLTSHIVNAIQNHQLVNDSTLHVVGVISNPARFHSRYRLARDFFARMRATENVQLHVVETAFGDRHHEVTGIGYHTANSTPLDTPISELQLRSTSECWLKENMINLGVRHLLPRDWKYLAWVDCDVEFAQPNWALETIHALQHYQVIQPWTQCIDMGPHGAALNMFTSFCSMVQRGERIQEHAGQPYKYGHSGFAWACTRRFWENVGGLMEFPVLGSADHHMAWGMVNKIDRSVHQKVTPSFKRLCDEWQMRAYRETKGQLGSIPCVLSHAWHGSKRKRRYRERWDILVEHGFDPDGDLRRDAQGVIHLVGKPRLEEEIRNYMRERHEDGIEE